MALTRKALKAMGLTEEQVESIVDMHTETLEGLKNKADQYEADAKKLESVQRELDELKQAEDGGYKARYEAEKKAHEDYRSEVAAKETAAKKKGLYERMLREAGVAEKYIASVMRATDFSGMELEGEALRDTEKLTQEAKASWADFIVTEKRDGADPETPPAGGGGAKDDLGKMSMEEYIAARKKM